MAASGRDVFSTRVDFRVLALLTPPHLPHYPALLLRLGRALLAQSLRLGLLPLGEVQAGALRLGQQHQERVYPCNARTPPMLVF